MLVICADEALALTLCFTSTAIRGPGLCRSHDPGPHPGAFLPGRDRRPVPGTASTGCDGPTWEATLPDWWDNNSRIRRRSSAPVPRVLYRQILALIISCGLRAHNNYSYIHKYMNTSFAADADLCAGVAGGFSIGAKSLCVEQDFPYRPRIVEEVYSLILWVDRALLASRAKARVFSGSRMPPLLMPVCTSTP